MVERKKIALNILNKQKLSPIISLSAVLPASPRLGRGMAEKTAPMVLTVFLGVGSTESKGFSETAS